MTCQMPSHSQKTALYNNVFHQRCLSQNAPVQLFALGIQSLGTNFIQQNWHTLKQRAKALARMRTTQRRWCYYLQNIFTWNYPSQSKIIWTVTTNVPLQLIDYIYYYKNHEFHLFGVFCEFSLAHNSSKGDQCSPVREGAESNSHSHTSLRKDSFTVAENLKKLLIFKKQMRRSFGKNIKSKKMKSGGPCPRAPGRAPQEPCHGFCFWKTPHIFRNLKTEVVIDYNIMYYYL